MAEKTKKTERKASPSEGRKPERKTAEIVEKKQQEKKGGSVVTLVALVLVLVAVVLIAFFFVLLPSQVSVPFSTFKSNLNSASRVAVILTYGNQSQFVRESQCAAQMIQVMAHSRNATTIDYYILNRTLCTYPVGGLGHTVSIANATPSKCLSMASAEPNVFLNYSQTNSSLVTAYKLYVYGNSQYMAACPISVDLS